jgi:hypothetical protein
MSHTRLLLPIAAILGIAIVIPALQDPRLDTSNLWKVDWQAVGSLIGAAGVLAAAYAGLMAKRAVDAALEIDRTQADRASKASVQRARSLALALHLEILWLRTGVRSFAKSLRQTDEKKFKADIDLFINGALPDISFEFLIRAADCAIDFGEEMAEDIAFALKTVTSVRSLRETIRAASDRYDRKIASSVAVRCDLVDSALEALDANLRSSGLLKEQHAAVGLPSE